MAIYATTATKKGSLAQKGQQELARQGANNTPRQGMAAQGARQVGAQTPAPGAAATRALGANPLAVTSTATAPYRAQQGVQQKGPGAAQAFATNAVPQGTARSFAANAVRYNNAANPAMQTRQTTALRSPAPNLAVTPGDVTGAQLANLAAAQPGGGMATRPGANQYAAGQGPGAEVADRPFDGGVAAMAPMSYAAIPPAAPAGPPGLAPLGPIAPTVTPGATPPQAGLAGAGGGAIPSDQDGATAGELGARGYYGPGTVAAGRGDTGVVAPAGVSGPNLGYAGGGSTAARVNEAGSTPTRYGTIPAGGGDPTRPDGGAYQSDQTVSTDHILRTGRDYWNRYTGGGADKADKAADEADKAVDEAVDEAAEKAEQAVDDAKDAVTPPTPPDPMQWLKDLLAQYANGSPAGDLMAKFAEMMGSNLSKTTDLMTDKDMGRIKKYFEDMWMKDQASSRKFADGLLDPNATNAWEEAAREEMMRGIGQQRDEALRMLEGRAGRGGAIGSGAQTGIYGAAMDAQRAGELGLTQGQFDRQLQRGQVGAGILDNANRQKWDMLSEGFTSNKELFNLLATMLPGLVDGIVPF